MKQNFQKQRKLFKGSNPYYFDFDIVCIIVPVLFSQTEFLGIYSYHNLYKLLSFFVLQVLNDFPVGSFILIQMYFP